MATKKRMKLASPGKRFAAYMIDVIPAWIIAGVLIVSSLLSAAGQLVNEFSMNPYGSFGSYGFDDGVYVSHSTSIASLILVLMMLAYVGIQLVFMYKSQTLGKALMGLVVVDDRTGQRIGFWKMLFREAIVKKAVGSVLWLGYFWILVDSKSRGWHDKILDTYVIDERLTIMTQDNFN